MKPRNKFEKSVAASNTRLTAISQNAVDWAIRTQIKHPAFRTSNIHTTCGDCGCKFDHKGKGKYAVCPECGRKLEVKDTNKRSSKDATFYATLDTIDGMQVERVFLLKVCFKKGAAMSVSNNEVCRLWINTQGELAVTSRKRSLGYYLDSFNWNSDIELRALTDSHWVISDDYVYPRYKVLPQLRRNGMKGILPNCHPARLMRALLSDSRIETLMKAGNHKAVEYFISNANMLDLCWNSHKIAMRHGYEIKDYSMWCDLIKLLDKCGRDTRSIRYICPADLKAEHDKWLAKVKAEEEKRRNMEHLKRAKKNEEDFYNSKSCYFDIVISDNDIEISVLDSIVIVKTCSDSSIPIVQKNCPMFVAKLHTFPHSHNRMKLYHLHSVL